MLTPIEYGVPTDKCGIQLRLGIAKGFFRDEGLDLGLRIVFGGPEIASAFDSGMLKVGELGTPPGLTAIAKGARFKIVGSSVRRGAVQYLVVKPGITDWAGLAGARLGALSQGSCSYWFMRQILSHNGLDPDRDVTIVGLGARYPEVVEMIAAGELAGAIIAEPNVTMGEDRGVFRVWLGLNGVDYVPRMQWCIAVANTRTLEGDPGLVEAVLRGCRRSYRYAADHQDEWAAFGAAYFGMSRQAMSACIAREIGDLHFDCQIDIEGLEAAITLQQGLGSIDRRLAIGAIADLRFQHLLAAA
jgi:ABC-type nitrate/sulfonate/bicarbonate transport system substrate-binding protein